MQIVQQTAAGSALSVDQLEQLAAIKPQLLLVFWNAEPLQQPPFIAALKAHLPDTIVIGCSTGAEIDASGVSEGCQLTAIHFDKVAVHVAEVELAELADSQAAGQRLGAALPKVGLRGVLLVAPGLDINGSAMLEGFAAELPPEVPISGGLAGDKGAFAKTFVLGPSGVSSSKLVAVGLYGEGLHFSTGSRGGWTAFGPSRRITRADTSRLYELDGQPALALYKKYLGDYARDLPSAALLFPFEMLDGQRKPLGLLRTILGIDEATQSLLLAGSVEEGTYVRLMHASADELVDGAEQAASDAVGNEDSAGGLALLVSCIGRKLVMGERVHEEVTAVAEQLGAGFTLAGFYSNGEISPLRDLLDCRLHNQTMTIALLSEH